MQESQERRNVSILGRSLTFTIVDQTSRRHNIATSRRWNVAMLPRRDVAAGFFTSSSLHFQKASENHPIHLQCTQDPKIRYRVIMHLLIYKIELKHNKDAGMT